MRVTQQQTDRMKRRKKKQYILFIYTTLQSVLIVMDNSEHLNDPLHLDKMHFARKRE